MSTTTLKFDKIPHHEPTTLREYDAIAKAMTANARAVMLAQGGCKPASKLNGHLRTIDNKVKWILGIKKIGFALDQEIPEDIFPMIDEARRLHDALINHSEPPRFQMVGDIAE